MKINSKVIKTQYPFRSDYVQLSLKCPICHQIQKQSKKFKSPYALKYHLTNFHNKQDEIEASITVDEVRKVIRSITKACQWKMFPSKTEDFTQMNATNTIVIEDTQGLIDKSLLLDWDEELQ